MKLKSTIQPLVKGYGQIILQDNLWIGGIVLLSLLIGNPFLFLCSILGLAISYFWSVLRGIDKDSAYSTGVFYFNPILVSLGFGILLPTNGYLLIFIVLGVIFSFEFFYWSYKKAWKVFTFPFVFTVWIGVFIHFFLVNKTDMPSLPIEEFSWTGSVRGFGQIFFLDSIIAGILLVLSFFFSNSRLAIIAILSSVLISFLAYKLLGIPSTAINNGLYSYNMILVVIVALSIDSKYTYTYLILGLLFTLLIEWFIYTSSFNWSMIGGKLTFPFVAVSWILLWINSLTTKDTVITIDNR